MRTNPLRILVFTFLSAAITVVLANRDVDVIPAGSAASPVLDPDDHEDWTDLVAAVDRIWSGGPEEKRIAAGDEEGLFEILDCSDVDCGSREVQRLVESLRGIVRAERDDWITTLLLDALEPADAELVRGLFLDALGGPSPNLRWRAIRWFGDEPWPEVRPLLEDLWEEDLRPWVRADLIAALGELEAPPDTDELAGLVRSGPAVVAAAAIEALGESGGPEALPALLRATREGSAPLRLRAITALRHFPRSDAALDRLLEAARSDDPSLVRAAVEALEDTDHPDVVPTLVEILRQPGPGEAATLHRLAIRILRNIDDPSAVPGLLGLDPGLGGEGEEGLAALIEYLTRERSDGGHTRSVTIRCGMTASGPEVDSETYHAVPPGDDASIRCWAAPGIGGDPEIHPRIDPTEVLRIVDYFERGGAVWAGVARSRQEACWVPLDLIEAGEVEGNGPVAGRPPEFDLPFHELDGGTGRCLLEMDLLELFDPSEGVRGVRPLLASGDRGQVAGFAKCYRGEDRLLDHLVRSLASDLLVRYEGDPEVGPLLEFARREPPGRDPPETVLDF